MAILYYIWLMFISPTPMQHHKHLKITEYLSIEEFESIKNMILYNGDRKTYCNRYNNNPHLKIGDFDAFLTPSDINNVFCDPVVSGFNEIVIYDPGKEIQYYHLKIMRTPTQDQQSLADSLGDEGVYLINIYDKNLVEMERQLKDYYLKELKKIAR